LYCITPLLPKLNFLTTAPTFPTQIVKLHELYQSFPTENDTRLIATTPQPQAPTALCQKLSHAHAPRRAAPRALLLLHCGFTTPMSGQTPVPGSAPVPHRIGQS